MEEMERVHSVMSRAVFAMRVAEVIAALRAEPDLPYATRRAVWLKLFELNDAFNRQAP